MYGIKDDFTYYELQEFTKNKFTKVRELDTEQAEMIQHDCLPRSVDHTEYYVAGGKIVAIYEFSEPNKWHLSEEADKRYRHGVEAKRVEWEINAGLNHLCPPELTAFKLNCGLIFEHDEADASPYVVYGEQGGEIDRWDEVEGLASCIIDILDERKE